MALLRKQPLFRAATPGSRLADLPHLPASLADQPGFIELDREQRRWWDDVRTAIGDLGIDRDKEYSKLVKSVTVGDATLSAAITTETTLRVTADAALASQITTLEANYQAADAALSASITTEATTRASADSAEASTRSSADATLQTNINTVSASVTTETNARVSADSALASSITTVEANYQAADTTLQTNIGKKITVAGSAPGSPATNDLWVDTSDNNKAKYWDGAAWQYKQDLILSASVTTEASARATADGFLSGKYTLTVAAGDVVTGMNITSSSGTGTNISDVTFVAANFKIYNGTIGKTMFEVAGSDVTLAGTLVTSTSGKVFIGTGTYNNSNTAFYVDSAGQFSLKDKLAWNGTTLTINGGGTFTGALSAATGSFSGTVTAGAGAIGGFDLGTDYIRDAANSFGLASTVTAGDDVRFWAGATFANRATAPFRITEAGVFVATSATITGTITSTSGTIGGFTIGATTFSAGSGTSYIEITSDVATKTFGMQLGVTGTGYHWTQITRHGILGFYVPSSDKGGYRLRSTDPTSATEEGRLDLYNSAGTISVMLRATNGSGQFTGTVRADTGFNHNGTAGASGSFDPAAVTNITVSGGLITGWS